MDILLVSLMSALAGFVDAVVGGGGLILVPALFAAYPSAPPASLLGTNKSASIWGTLFAAWQYNRRVQLAWKALLWASVLAFLGSWAGAHVLTFHIETCANEAAARAVVRGFRKLGIERVGVSLNPDTEVERVAPILDEVDLVLVMSVFPGFGGQKFMPQVLEKGQRLRAAGFAGLLEIDGGVNRDTIAACAGAGFDSFVMGSALYGAADMGLELAHCRARAVEARGTSSRHGSS